MPSKWAIRFWPECDRHVFLSHCQEDHDSLVRPVYKELERRRLIPWIDRHHYPLGHDGFQSLREELLKSRHVVYFITLSAVRQGRGWMAAERVFTELVQRQLTYGDEIAHVELPLLLLPQDNPIFQRSLWRALIDKARVPNDLQLPDNVDWAAAHVQWCADTIERFVTQEEQWGFELAFRMEQDSSLKQQFKGEPRRMRRILAQMPQRIEVV